MTLSLAEGIIDDAHVLSYLLSDDSGVTQDDGGEWQHKLRDVGKCTIERPFHAGPGFRALLLALVHLDAHVKCVGRGEDAGQEIDEEYEYEAGFGLHTGSERVDDDHEAV